MELAYSGLHQLCAPMLDHLDRLPSPTARRARDRVWTWRRRCARPVSGWASDSRASWPTPPSSGHWSASSTTRSGSTRPPHRSLPLSAAACSPSGSRWCAQRGPASATRSSTGFPSCRSTGSTTAMPARCCWTTCMDRSMPPSATRSSTKATATRSRFSSCRARGGPQISPVASGCPARQLVAGKIEQSYVRRLSLLPSDTRLLVLTRGRGAASASRRCSTARRRSLGIDVAAAVPAMDAGLLHVGCAGGVRPSTRPIRHVPWGHCRGPAARTSCARRGHGHRGGPGPARLASRPSYARTGRGGRRRARALRRTGTGSRRGRCCGRLSDPRDRTDARSNAASSAGARCRLRQRAGGDIRHRPDSDRRSQQRPGRPVATRTHRPAPCPARVRIEPRHRSDHSVLAAAQHLEPLDAHLARETYLDALSAACSEPDSMTPSACPRSPGPLVPCRSDPSRSPRLPTCCWTGSSR